eukprot:gb/GECG01000953.1/.p1 GENE.gb/GECG01000953.1/~~gb/GECG01000953.1/.p1  ORF type:complete len:593 (+),score=75.27 gb/GECG01000953.1/:1-1779(+)
MASKSNVFVGGGKDSGVSQALDEIEELIHDTSVWEHVDGIIHEEERVQHTGEFSEPVENTFNHAKKLMQSLNHLESLQAAYVPVDSALPLARRIHNFNRWVREEGGVHLESKQTPLKVASIEGKGLGTIATDDISTAERILQVPESLMISMKTALQSPWGKAIKNDPQLQNMPEISLALHLLLEASHANEATNAAEDAICDSAYLPTDAAGSEATALTRGSFWRPYLALLPPTCPNVLSLQGSHMDMLRHSGKIGRELLLTGIKTIRSTVKAYLTLHRRYVPEKHDGKQKDHKKGSFGDSMCSVPGLSRSNFSWAGFRWAVCMVMSRQNKVPIAGFSESVLSLVPIWDIINHENIVESGITTTGELHDGQCVLSHFAPRNFRNGEEVTMYYGDRDNFKFLKFSGFTVKNNPNERVSVEFPLTAASDDELRKLRNLLLKNLGYIKEKLSEDQGQLRISVAPSRRREFAYEDLQSYFVEELILVTKICYGKKEDLDNVLRQSKNGRKRLSCTLPLSLKEKLLSVTSACLDLSSERSPFTATATESSVENVIERGTCVYSSGDVTASIWGYIDERRNVHQQLWGSLNAALQAQGE